MCVNLKVRVGTGDHSEIQVSLLWVVTSFKCGQHQLVVTLLQLTILRIDRRLLNSKGLENVSDYSRTSSILFQKFQLHQWKLKSELHSEINKKHGSIFCHEMDGRGKSTISTSMVKCWLTSVARYASSLVSKIFFICMPEKRSVAGDPVIAATSWVGHNRHVITL